MHDVTLLLSTGAKNSRHSVSILELLYIRTFCLWWLLLLLMDSCLVCTCISCIWGMCMLYLQLYVHRSTYIRYCSCLSWHSHAATRVCSCIFVEWPGLKSCVTRELTFMQSTRALFCALHEIHLRVLHNCKKPASNTSCVARQSVFLCAAHKLTAIAFQRRIKPYDEMAC